MKYPTVRRPRLSRLAPVVVVVTVAVGMLVARALPQPAQVTIDPVAGTTSPTQEPVVATESSVPSASIEPSPSETTIPERPSPTPAPVSETSTAAPTAVPTADAPVVPIREEVTTDQPHYYAGELVTLTVRACNDDPDRAAIYHSDYTVDFVGRIQNRWGTVVHDPVRYEDAHWREGSIAPGECLSFTTTWDRTGYEGEAAPAGEYQVWGGFFGIQQGAERYSKPDLTRWIVLHDEPRPADGGQTEPLPQDYKPEPEWTATVTTDKASYTVGEPVRITVTVCNESDHRQGYSYGPGTLHPFDLWIINMAEYGQQDPQDRAELFNDPAPSGQSDEDQPDYMIEAGDCATWSAVWRGTRGEFRYDGSGDGQSVNPGTYRITLNIAGPREGDGPHGVDTWAHVDLT